MKYIIKLIFLPLYIVSLPMIIFEEKMEQLGGKVRRK